MKGIKAIYDNGGETIDRYTVYYSERSKWGYAHEYNKEGKEIYPCMAMNGAPFHPQGFGQHSTGVLGRHNGKKIKFEELPKDCQTVVRRGLK